MTEQQVQEFNTLKEKAQKEQLTPTEKERFEMLIQMASTPKPNNTLTKPQSKAGLALLPVTPVPFTGKDAIYAYGRIGLYGTIAALSWKRSKTLAYISLGAAGVSLLTSLGGNAWNGAQNPYSNGGN